ncbi:hypothetical protein CEP54_010633 [Fusarium duplospermum]|uniref:Calcineurin-like phosphoesterase domain-containing protein n=1 Tax=Fusarium duplospermum TaxID=1325734 RepID=A0A428PIX4_9HYPO|nr:hypothetical protein CEP54_010633 [Fusarium duplospermum]
MASRTLAVASSLFALSHAASIPRAVNNDNLPALKFTSEGTFQIAVFSDMHFGQLASTTGPAQDAKSVQVISDVLDYELPDLVVLNGDLINGDSTFKHNSTHYIDQIVAPIIERNLTWASTYGNHDHNYYITGEGILEREQMWPGARTKSMVDDEDAGTSNYYLPVYASNCTNTNKCTPELLLWFFDSRGGRYYEADDQENWVDESVVTWFNETNTELVNKYNKVIPALAFVHIPINATMSIQTEVGIDENKQPGLNYDPPVAQQGEGWCANGTRDTDNCHYGGQDKLFTEALVTIPGIIGLFFGHDHGNTWCYRWEGSLPGVEVEGNGLNLCYGQHSGYGGYGDWIRGAREIIVSQDKLADKIIDTHIRLESGDIVGAVTLNSTYNEDSYTATPDDKTYLSDTGDFSNAEEMSAGVSLTPEFLYAAIGGSLVTMAYLCL